MFNKSSPWTNGLFVNLLLRREDDSGESSTSATGHLTSENVSATTSAISTTEESNIRAGKFGSRKKRKYQETYLEHGFTYSTINGEQRPQCVIAPKYWRTKA
jgi:hypothetical protein